MRIKLMMVTLEMARASVNRNLAGDEVVGERGRLKGGRYLHRADEQLDAHCDLPMQTHLQIYDPHDRDAEDEDIGDEVRDACSQPTRTRLRAMAEAWRPSRSQRLALGEVIGDATDEKPADGGKGGHLDHARVLPPGVRHEYSPVQNDEGELEEAEGSGPGQFFDEECLGRKVSNAVCANIFVPAVYLESPPNLIRRQPVNIPSNTSAQDR